MALLNSQNERQSYRAIWRNQKSNKLIYCSEMTNPHAQERGLIEIALNVSPKNGPAIN
jgi:hypothetical protein